MIRKTPGGIEIADGLIRYLPQLKGNAFGVLLALASNQDDHGEVMLTVEQIMFITGLSKPSAIAALRRLARVEIDGRQVVQIGQRWRASGSRRDRVYRLFKHAGVSND